MRTRHAQEHTAASDRHTSLTVYPDPTSQPIPDTLSWGLATNHPPCSDIQNQLPAQLIHAVDIMPALRELEAQGVH
jgi:hypothetical protein